MRSILETFLKSTTKTFVTEWVFSPPFFFFSDGWAKDDLIYQWKEKDPVQVVPGLHLPRFTLEQYKSAYCDVTTNTGEDIMK